MTQNIGEQGLPMDVFNLRIKSLFEDYKIIVAEEKHKEGDTHYHAFIIDNKKDGTLSKNTYHKTFRKLFPEFPGIILDVQRTKRPAKLLLYLFKDVKRTDIIRFIRKGFAPGI